MGVIAQAAIVGSSWGRAAELAKSNQYVAPICSNSKRKLLVGLRALGIIVLLAIVFFAFVKAAIDGEVGM